MKPYILTVIIGALAFSISGQTRPLKLSVTSPQGFSGCLGDKLHLSLTLINVTKKRVVIEKGRVGAWRFFEYVGSGRTRDDSFADGEGPPTHYVPEYLNLQPKESYSTSLYYDLDPQQFNKLGRYTMEIEYSRHTDAMFEGLKVWTGQALSKKTLVVVNDCGT